MTIFNSEEVYAGSYSGEDLALAILKDPSTLIDSYYEDSDHSGHRQAIVLSSLGTMVPTHDNTFALFSTGIAGSVPVTTDEDGDDVGENPGDERGTWFKNQNGNPRDSSSLTMTLKVPPFMHYIYYDIQFFTTEWPEYSSEKYNDKLTITVNSPSQGISIYVFDVFSKPGYFVLSANDIPGTGFDIFAQSGNPSEVDLVDTTPRTPGSDANATDIIPIGGVTHPVSPNEQIVVTINIKDAGDNMFDSAAFIDNLRFSGYAKTEIIARKSVVDLNGGDLLCNDTLRYRVTISNTGSADQTDNFGDEFEDFLPNDVTYVNGSATATSGFISYGYYDWDINMDWEIGSDDSDLINASFGQTGTPGWIREDVNNDGKVDNLDLNIVIGHYGETYDYAGGENKITWNGDIQAETSCVLEFKVVVNEGLENGHIISNQGLVYWDTDEGGKNDAIEYTDDIYIDDKIDQDGDGDTDDDDPTDVTIYAFDKPSYVTEDFSDDISGGNASQFYLSRKWFEAPESVLCGSYFEVAPYYHYSTAKSFKTKFRNSDSPQYWYYYLSNLDNAKLEWWEVWFTCGDTSEEYSLFIDLETNSGTDIAKIKLIYVKKGFKPMPWVLELYYYDSGDWMRLNSYYTSGYLCNNWYKLRIEKFGSNYINYTLSMTDIGVVDSAQGNVLSGSFSNFERVEWSSTTSPDPVVCPIFFWDEHKIGLSYPS